MRTAAECPVLYLVSRRHETEPGETARAVWQGKTDTAWRSILGTMTLLLIAAGIGLALQLQIPCPRHRQGRPGCALSDAESDPHRPGDRHPHHAGDAAVRGVARHRRRLLPRLGG
ncbi:MAG: hypothetical protein MPW15_07675 [Candidatus Manganitrophus sp.]|nr:hypothetical protein [Candidatus Manganitrophus sp.]